jgi:hypothetical protein
MTTGGEEFMVWRTISAQKACSKVSPKWIRILWEIRCYIGGQGASDTLVPGHVETQTQSGKETACQGRSTK